MTQDDENPVYGVYFDPDPRMEVEDANATTITPQIMNQLEQAG